MAYRAVIYDCDGVMFDSFEANVAFYERILNVLGHRLDRQNGETMRVLHTYANRDVLTHFFPDEPLQSRALACASEIDYRDLIPLMKIEAGFRETLELLFDNPSSGESISAMCDSQGDDILEQAQDAGKTMRWTIRKH